MIEKNMPTKTWTSTRTTIGVRGDHGLPLIASRHAKTSITWVVTWLSPFMKAQTALGLRALILLQRPNVHSAATSLSWPRVLLGQDALYFDPWEPIPPHCHYCAIPIGTLLVSSPHSSAVRLSLANLALRSYHCSWTSHTLT